MKDTYQRAMNPCGKTRYTQLVNCPIEMVAILLLMSMIGAAHARGETVVAEGAATWQVGDSIDNVRHKAILAGLIKAIQQRYGESMTAYERYTTNGRKGDYAIGIHSSINGRGKILDILSERVQESEQGRIMLVKVKYEVFDKLMPVNYYTLNVLWQAIGSPGIEIDIQGDNQSSSVVPAVSAKLHDILLQSHIEIRRSSMKLILQLATDRQKTIFNTNHHIVCTRLHLEFAASGSVFSLIETGSWSVALDPRTAAVQSINNSDFFERLEEDLCMHLYEFAFQNYYYGVLNK
ncbi:MAG: hypothetical protein A2X81_12885 [Desulfobacterales bacterium GWB2_56_26]|nr:MAG: hypothetical protein A2X81_12885 [Desulfobacterales bacterium GWB2_56_26]